MDTKNRVIMLILTDNCNLRCSYCYENGEIKKAMRFETARAVIDRTFAGMPEDAMGRIEFFGGEALLEFALLKRIYEYVKVQYSSCHIRFAFTTNGTLMHGNVRQWFWEHREDFACTLSLDGTEAMHNRNRRTKGGEGSFNAIDVDFFRKTWPDCTAKMTVSPETLPDLAEGIMYLESLGFYCKATFASGMDWKQEEYKEILMRELNKLTEYYSRNDIHLCNMLDLDLRAIFNGPEAPFRYCEAGVGKQCYDMEGRAYPCQGLASVSVGEERAYLFEGECFENFCMSEDNPCRLCRWLRVCRTCYAANYLETGSVERNCENVCFLNRMAILASSAIQYRRIMKKSERTPAEALTLKAVVMIQKNILSEYGMK